VSKRRASPPKPTLTAASPSGDATAPGDWLCTLLLAIGCLFYFGFFFAQPVAQGAGGTVYRGQLLLY
jgi:hypothetical protein